MDDSFLTSENNEVATHDGRSCAAGTQVHVGSEEGELKVVLWCAFAWDKQEGGGVFSLRDGGMVKILENWEEGYTKRNAWDSRNGLMAKIFIA